jgi:hypothetical protein
MKKFKDLFGNELHIGDKVLYQSAHYQTFKFTEILKFGPKFVCVKTYDGIGNKTIGYPSSSLIKITEEQFEYLKHKEDE